jgi:hypothetical protein
VAYGLSNAALPGYTRATTPLGLVWESPTKVKVPVAQYLGDLLADAGADQCLESTGALTNVTLDASGSASLAGNIARVRWYLPNCIVEGAKVVAPLPAGVHDIEVEVVDSTGNRARDRVLISIE